MENGENQKEEMKSGGDYSERIKLERLKRSWTQERLAEEAGLSARTLQRLETGTAPSMETLRSLARAFGVEVEELRRQELRRHFLAPWDKELKITTGVFCAILIGVAIALQSPFSMAPLAILVVCSAFAVNGYSVKGRSLLIHRLGWSSKYDLGKLTAIRVEPHVMMGSIRVFGIGGLFATVGYFRNQILGTYRAYVTSSGRTLILEIGKNTIVISPDSPSELKQVIENQLANAVEGPLDT